MDEITKIIAGNLGLLAFLLIGQRRVWVWGWQYDDVVAERDEYRALLMQGLNVAEKSTDVAERAVERPSRSRKKR